MSNMTSYRALAIAEGFVEAEDEDEMVAAWQRLIDSGLSWTSHGTIGRQAAAMIEEGLCHG